MQILQRTITYFLFPSTTATRDAPTTPNLPPVKTDNASDRTLAADDDDTKHPYRWRHLGIHLFLLACSGTTLGLLALYVHGFEGKELPEGSSAVLSLNAAVAWMGALAKVLALVPLADAIGQAKWRLFDGCRRKLSDLELADGAGRGPLGALGWLLRFRGGLVVHLGAAAVLVSIGFDPALQMLLRYETAEVADASLAASVAVNAAYTPARGFDQGLVLAAPQALLRGVYAAALDSASNDGGGLPISFTCPSGNCTYPLSVSVGVCTSCTDASSQLRENCTDLSDANRFNASSAVSFTEGKMCRYSLNNATAGGGSTFLEIATGDSSNSTNPAAGGKLAIAADRVNLTAVYIQPAGISDLPAGVSNASVGNPVLPLAPGYVAPGAPSPARAFTCRIRYCEKRLSPAVVRGAYTEGSRTVSTSQGALDTFVLAAPRLDDITDALYGQLLNLTNAPDAAQISLAALYALGSGLGLALQGRAGVLTSLTPDAADISELHRALYQRATSASAGFESVAAQLSAAMSRAVRNDASGHLLPGTVWVRRTSVRVAWAWLALPVGVWAVALLLVLVETVSARRRHAPWLGGSQLAGLLIGLEDEVRRDLDLQDAGWKDRFGMCDIAEKVKLRVAPAHGLSDQRAKMQFTRLNSIRSPV